MRSPSAIDELGVLARLIAMSAMDSGNLTRLDEAQSRALDTVAKEQSATVFKVGTGDVRVVNNEVLVGLWKTEGGQTRQDWMCAGKLATRDLTAIEGRALTDAANDDLAFTKLDTNTEIAKLNGKIVVAQIKADENSERRRHWSVIF
jgi:hypothetical protein